MTADTQTQVLLQVHDLLVQRGDTTVLEIPALEVLQGQVLSLIGPNGAGKSTLMLTLAGLLKAARGTLSFRGEPVTDGGFAYRRHIAMVFQDPLLFDTTVFDNVATGLKIRGMGRSDIARLVPEYLERFGVGQLAKRSARKLSGGEAQRTSLARAFVTKPEIIFLDEPFSALDPPTREVLTSDLEKILRETHTTAVASTHDQTEALRLADRIAVINEGKIAQIGTVPEVMNRPADEFVASFVGVETVLPGRVIRTEGGLFTAALEGGKEIEAIGSMAVGADVFCCIRPENVTLSLHPAPSGSSARNVFAGRIRQITPLGLFYRIRLDCGFDLVSYVTGRSLEEMGLKEGLAVTATFKATAIHVIERSGAAEER
jgi:tungstate transport system ATP-binding protein